MENNELKLGKGLMHHIRESNKFRDSKGRYCKPKSLINITLKEFEEIIVCLDKRKHFNIQVDTEGRI